MDAETAETKRLIELAVQGDKASWGILITEHLDRLTRLVALRLDQRLQGRIDAGDVIQEICLEAWHHLPEYVRGSTLPFYFWLRGLARNKLCELHRQHFGAKMRDVRREEPSPLYSMPETTSSALSSLFLDSGTSPSGAAIRSEMKIHLHEALEGMDAIDREVLALRHFEQLTPTETAQILGINQKAAGMRYLRAIKRLKDVLAMLPGGLLEFHL